ncbi:MAG: ribosome small subunit-dependent GTPase A [Cyclobacteriaceae bacterium]|nr:ribosome small subunit-dependent GTPase A [Cyclobacteriaceae bacterium]
MIGRVLKSTGSWYEVAGEDTLRYACRARGKLRLEGYKESNPIAVGDQVQFEPLGKEGIITEILPRQNHMLRQSVKRTGHASVLAANLNQVLVLATLKQPRTSLGFIDRVLVSAESFRIPQVIVFNKKDLLTADEVAELDELTQLYQHIGATVLIISAQHDAEVETVQLQLQGKVTLVAGHSGVGKSTLLNRLLPGLKLATGAISDYSEKGTHTTTFAEMFQVNENTFIIDTPGIKEWGLVDMEPQEISDYFPEMRNLRLSCRFGSRCLHLNEPKCAVLDAVEQGTIAASRYNSYISMATGEDTRQ